MYLALWLGLISSGALAQERPDQTLRLTRAEVAYGSAATPPAQGWQAVAIPDVSVAQARPGDATGWYRFDFDLASPPAEPLVLLVQRVALTAEFRLNGSLLNPGVHFESPGGRAGTQMLNWPQWIVLSPALFRSGHNELQIRLAGSRIIPARISGISIGKPEALRGEFLLRDIPQRLVPQAQFVILLAALVFGLPLWLRERQRYQTRTLVTTVLWLASLGTYLVPDIPLPWRSSMVLIACIWIAFHWALMDLLWRLTDQRLPWFPRALQFGSVLQLMGALLLLAVEPKVALLGFLMLPTNVLRSLLTLRVLQWAWRARTRSAILLAGSELLWFAGPLQLMLVALDFVPPDPFILAPGSGLPMALLILWQGARRLAREREEAGLQRQLAVIEERQRLMLDMHDGVGSQLVTALRLARRDDVPRGDLVQVIQDALRDLRLVIEAQDTAARDLQTLLQQWLERNQSRLTGLGTRLNCVLEALPAPRPLSPQEALQILRILQEALNNALQHSGSSSIHVALKLAPGGCEVSIADDGEGIVAVEEGSRRGRGLDSMRLRAERLGGRLEVRRGEARGTVVRLMLPDVARV